MFDLNVEAQLDAAFPPDISIDISLDTAPEIEVEVDASAQPDIDIMVSVPGVAEEARKPEQTKSLIITENGNYEILPDDGYALSEAHVEVDVESEAVLPAIQALEVTENGTYTAPDGVDGYSPITVKVDVELPDVPDPVIQPLEITENGTYIAPEGVDGYSPVTVHIESSGGDDMAGALADRTITEFSSSGCTKIAAYSFRGCASLKTLVAPNAKSVGEYALYGCNELLSIVLPSVTTVSSNAFREASDLEVIDFPKLTAIPSTAFYGCRGLKALILRSATMVTLSATSAFTQCYRMLGTKNPGYNPTGEKIGWVYVPSVLLDEYLADSMWISSGLQFRAIEDYPEICG